MIALPPALGGTTTLTAWRIDAARFRTDWDRGEGARLYGGRWNAPGNAAVYCSLEPSTAILEVAVHTGFAVLARIPHVISSMVIANPATVHVIQPEDVPDPAWLRPGWPSGAQQAYGDALLDAHAFVLWPSTVSRLSWNLVCRPQRAAGHYQLAAQQALELDPRLNNPEPRRS